MSLNVNLNDLTFQKLNAEGVQTLVSWAKDEGWNPGPHDAEVFYATDSDGFYGYYFNGVLIAGGSVVSYNGEFGFMGLFIVKPEFRSEGIGKSLWYHRRDLLLNRLNEGAFIGMDGVVAMQPFYQKGGFEILFKDERYEKIGATYSTHPNISSIEATDFDQISAFDTACFGFERPQFLKPWLALPNGATFKYTAEQILKGFAVVRKANQGYKIGPLFADNATVAEELYKACLNACIDQPVYLDIPMVNESAIDLVRKYEAQYVFECARMYYGTPPQIDMNKVFGITSFELG